MSSQATPTQRYQVVIVGGGPVGMGLAIELGQRGIRTAVIERYETPQPIPKGQNLTQRTMEHFHFWGAEKELREARTIPPEFGIGGLTAYGTLLSPYHYDWLTRALVKQYYFKANERLPQYATEAVLRARVAQLGNVDVMLGWTAESVENLDDRTRVTARPRKGGDSLTLEADYVVGCDGARSVVRSDTGMTQTLQDHERLMVLLVFKSTQLHELLARYPDKCYFNVLRPELEGYWKFIGRVDLGTSWFFHAPVPVGTTKDNFDFKSFVQEAVGEDFELTIDHIGFWDLRFALNDDYRAGRAFVAGDAAHSHPPYGGYGVNSGLEDARNLGWKLAASLQGWGGPALLDSYDVERRWVFESTIKDFIAKSIEVDREFLATYSPERDLGEFEAAWNARKTGAPSEVNAFEPNYEGSPVVTMPPGKTGRGGSSVGSHEFTARAGHHLAPAMLSSGRNVFEELGSGFTLLAFDAADDEVAAFEQAADARGIPLTVVRDTAEGERARYGSSLVLIRPDHYVAWAAQAGAASADAAGILDKAAGFSS